MKILYFRFRLIFLTRIFLFLELWLEPICELVPIDDNDVHNNKVISNGSVPHKKPEKQDTLCTEVSNKKLVNNDKLM